MGSFRLFLLDIFITNKKERKLANMVIDLSKKPDKIYSGIYKINFPNNKVYIGLSNNIYRRICEHNIDFRKRTACSNAIKKYGKIDRIEILEEIDPDDREKLQEREKYWIEYYQSNDKRYGYNLTSGGDGSDIGSQNLQAKLTEQQYFEVVDLLKNHLELRMKDIADMYDLSLSGISELNNGVHYWHSCVDYPIRTSKDSGKLRSGVKNIHSNLTEGQIDLAYSLLLHSNKTLKEISEITKIKIEKLREINRGFRYRKDNFTYPLRRLHKGSKQLKPEQVSEIYSTILNTNESFVSISKRFKVNPKTISGINCGTTYKRKGYSYPLRKK